MMALIVKMANQLVDLKTNLCEDWDIKLLAINFGGLGDEVLFLPTLKSIKLAQPLWHITLLTEPRARSIADVSDLIDDNITFDIKKKPLKPADYAELVGMLRAGKFDVILSSGGSPQVAGLLFLSGIKKRVGYGSNPLAKLLLTDHVPLNKKQHASFMYHDLVKGLAISATPQRPEVIVHDANLQAMSALLNLGTTRGAPIVLLHPGTSKLAVEKGIIKNWEPGNWAGLIERLLSQNIKIILAGGPDDEGTIQQIQSQLKDASKNSNFLNAYGKTSNLRDLVALIELADVVVCVDSAPMHLAIGRDKPTVALFGPTDPSKLLWPADHFVALRDSAWAQSLGDADIFELMANPAKRSEVSLPQQPYVQIPLDTVYRTAMDLLRSTASRGSSPESLQR